MSAPSGHRPRSRFTLVVTLLSLAVIPGFFLPSGAFVPGLDDELTRAERSPGPRPTSNWGTRPDFEPLVTRYASAYGVRPELVHAVIQKESNGDPLAVGPAGEQGLMQLMPKTAQALGVRNRFDVEENIRGGVEYLSQLLTRFGDERKALAAYHTGPGTVSREGITRRGHAYASEILTNAKKRSFAPAQVVGRSDTRTAAPESETAVTRGIPPGVKWALATSGGPRYEGLVPPPARDSLLRLPVDGAKQVVKGLVGATKVGVDQRGGPLSRIETPGRWQAMAAAADRLAGLGGVASPAVCPAPDLAMGPIDVAPTTGLALVGGDPVPVTLQARTGPILRHSNSLTSPQGRPDPAEQLLRVCRVQAPAEGSS